MTLAGPLRLISGMSSSVMVVLTVPALTVAVVLERVRAKTSLASTSTSPVVGRVMSRSLLPAARSTPLFRTVTLTAPLAPAVVLSASWPEAAASDPATRALKSVASVAVSLEESSVKVTLRPAPSPTPSRATV